MDNRERGPSSLFRERSELKNTILTVITVCGSFTPPEIQLNYDTIYRQISQVKGCVLQDCTTVPLHPYCKHQTQVQVVPHAFDGPAIGHRFQ